MASKKLTPKASDKQKSPTTAPAQEPSKKSRVSQADVPRHTVQEALRIPQAIAEEYAGAATKPLNVAAVG